MTSEAGEDPAVASQRPARQGPLASLPFELQIAGRYLMLRKRGMFISVISAISALGVVLGVAILLVALAIMTGFQGELRARILGALSHLTVYSLSAEGFTDYRDAVETIQDVPGVEAATPVVYGKAIAVGRRDALVTLKGVDPALEPGVSEFASRMTAGEFSELGIVTPGDPPPVLLGEELAIALGAGIGETIRLMVPGGRLTPLGTVPTTRRFRVAGSFRLGLYDYDNAYALIPIREAQRLTGRSDEASQVEARAADMFQVRDLEARVRETLGPGYSTLNWIDLNTTLFSAFWLEKLATALFVSFIVGVAALNIVAGQIVTVTEKTRDIAILRSMGATRRSIMALFMAQGAVIGTVGTGVGAALGIVACRILDGRIRIPEDVYQITSVPFTLLPGDVALVCIFAPLVCFLATVYPARRAASLVVTDALRFQ
ncbi:MAG: ABC transporter permease [Acidobacteria bacterium]|nr:ABC transporter permease [Acidobacteriota bacterium]